MFKKRKFNIYRQQLSNNVKNVTQKVKFSKQKPIAKSGIEPTSLQYSVDKFS